MSEPQTMEFYQSEQAVCTCEAAIPGDMMSRELLPTAPYVATRERVTACCVHCETAWQVDRELRGGVWVNLQPPRKLAGQRRQAAFKKFDDIRAIRRAS